jgi:uncharacterized protein YbaP (TraB family)
MRLLNRLKSNAAQGLRIAAGSVLGIALAGAVAAMSAAALAQAAPQMAPAAVSEQSSGPALWVVRDEDSTLYLFGTVHLLKPDTEWRTPEVDAAMASADTIWMEIADVDNPTGAQEVMMRLGLSPDRPLSSLLSAEELAALDATARQLGASAAALDPMRPWLAALQISVSAIVKAGFDPASGVELKLLAAAREAGTPVRGLETVEEQLSYIANLPDPVQIAFLNQSIAEFAEAETALNAMVDAWAAGDVAGLEALGIEEFRTDYPELYDAILVRRNAAWTEQITTILEGSGTTFIAVGALHLAGDDSVQSMLAARGVTATRH